MIGIDRYRRNAVTLASPAQLVMMLFETALRRLERARSSLDAGRPAVEDLHRVREILMELSDALDDQAAPELCKQLRPLYAWMIQELVCAERERDADKVEDVASALYPLAEGWRTVVDGDLAQAAGL